MNQRPLCRHCAHYVISCPRGLCWTCYQSPEIRAQYPSTSKYGAKGVPDFDGAAPLPIAGTLARPGSEAKLLVLMERCRAGQALVHPEDATWAPMEGAVA